MNKKNEAPKGEKTTVILDGKKIEGVHIPLDPKMEEKFRRASSLGIYWKKIVLHG